MNVIMIPLYFLWKITSAGWHAEGVDGNGNRISLCTYCEESAPEPKDLVQSQGAIVLDCRSMSEESILDAVLKGPMHEPGLPPGTVREPLSEPRAYVKGETLSALMQCSTCIYVNFWLSFP